MPGSKQRVVEKDPVGPDSAGVDEGTGLPPRVYPFHLLPAVDPALLPAHLRRFGLPVNWPIPVCVETGTIVEPVLRFLYESCKVRRGGSRLRTVNAYANDLKDWWGYLSYYEFREWTDVGSEDVAAYRDAMSGTVAPATGREYQDQTIIRRVGTVIRFYRWANREKLVETHIVELSHERTRDESSSLLPANRKGDDGEVRVIPIRDLELIRVHLGPMPSEVDQYDVRSRSRLYMELMVTTGGRISEIAGIQASDIKRLRIEGMNPWDRVPLRLFRNTKGGKVRDVLVPVYLVRELLKYIEGEREHIARMVGGCVPDALFLNGTESTAYAGRPFAPHRMWELFHGALLSAGLTRDVLIKDPATGKHTVRPVPMFRPHDLRHTFAVNEYHGRRRAGDPEPWKAVQELLGHASLATTLRIYLRICRNTEAEVSDASYNFFKAVVARENDGPSD